MKTTALIIGGGLGGLFAGAILAKEGVGVTILEKNHIIGGGLQSFRRMGLSFDTGMHVLAGMEEGQSIRRLCEWLGIYDKIRLHHIGPDIIDTLFFGEDGKFYDIGKGREGFVDSLAKYFPDQRQNLENYVSAMYAITDKLDLFHLRPSQGFVQIHTDEALMAADAFIAKYISDPRLRGVVAYMNLLYSGRADETPAYIHAIISVLYIQGPSRFIGGSLHFAKILQEFIEQHGGQVLTGSPVVKINTMDRSITSVETPDGRQWSADWYISDIHPCSLISLLDDPKALPKPFRNRMQEIPNSYSAFTLSIKLKKDSFRYLDHSMYFIDRYDEVWSFGDTSKKWPLGYLMMTPPEEGQGEFAEKIILTAPMLWNEVSRWADSTVGHRPAEYLRWKEECAQILLDRMEMMFPGFRGCVEDYNTASPLTVRDFYGVKEGAMCGFSKDCHNLLLSQVTVVTKIPNLLLTGQNVTLHGFCGVPVTAINTCDVILGHNYVVNKINGIE